MMTARPQRNFGQAKSDFRGHLGLGDGDSEGQTVGGGWLEKARRGWVASRMGLRVTLLAGLALQVVALGMLSLGSFLGGRIAIHPHQLHVAERATAADPVRWLLADEVGLGKTVEACLILSRLLRTGRADRALIVAPSTLTIQWLGELYRKFHQTFVLLDAKRRDDVVKENGEGFNPFEAHRHMVIGLEDLEADPRLPGLAASARLDLLVVDEAQQLTGGEGVTKILIVPGLPRDAKTRQRSVELLRAKGVDGVISFRAILQELIAGVHTNRNYQKSDLLQILRLLKNYDLLKEPQLELKLRRKK